MAKRISIPSAIIICVSALAYIMYKADLAYYFEREPESFGERRPHYSYETKQERHARFNNNVAVQNNKQSEKIEMPKPAERPNPLAHIKKVEPALFDRNGIRVNGKNPVMDFADKIFIESKNGTKLSDFGLNLMAHMVGLRYSDAHYLSRQLRELAENNISAIYGVYDQGKESDDSLLTDKLREEIKGRSIFWETVKNPFRLASDVIVKYRRYNGELQKPFVTQPKPERLIKDEKGEIVDAAPEPIIVDFDKVREEKKAKLGKKEEIDISPSAYASKSEVRYGTRVTQKERRAQKKDEILAAKGEDGSDRTGEGTIEEAAQLEDVVKRLLKQHEEDRKSESLNLPLIEKALAKVLDEQKRSAEAQLTVVPKQMVQVTQDVLSKVGEQKKKKRLPKFAVDVLAQTPCKYGEKCNIADCYFKHDRVRTTEASSTSEEPKKRTPEAAVSGALKFVAPKAPHVLVLKQGETRVGYIAKYTWKDAVSEKTFFLTPDHYRTGYDNLSVHDLNDRLLDDQPKFIRVPLDDIPGFIGTPDLALYIPSKEPQIRSYTIDTNTNPVSVYLHSFRNGQWLVCASKVPIQLDSTHIEIPYTCDTQPGDCGQPVITNGGTVKGLHCAALEKSELNSFVPFSIPVLMKVLDAQCRI
jgi:hypothetical protein